MEVEYIGYYLFKIRCGKLFC